MATTVTITGTTGPGVALTTQVFEGVIKLTFDYLAKTIAIQTADKITYVSYYGIATVTYTISGADATVTIS